MRETKFIEQNKEKWKIFERIMRFSKKDPDKLSKLFVQITDDLSYSRTFYPNRSVRVYLNNLAQQIFYSIYKNKKTTRGRFSLFWSDELPQLVWEARREILTAALVFFLAFFIGAFSCAQDPEFVKVILGEEYVKMTITNIESGDPMAVYKQQNQVDMAFGITVNNLAVAFMTFILGALFAIGTIGALIYNGVMIGAFHYFLYEQGVLREALLTVWVHGTLEISAIIIAGAAGLTLGRGLILPGTYSRLQAFQLSAKRGLKIMLGIAPIIVLAGFIEGFVTRYTDAPEMMRLGIILASLSFIVTYFIWYPWVKNKEGFATKIQEEKLPPSGKQLIDFTVIKSMGQIFTDTFVFYRKHIKPLFWVAGILSTIYLGTMLLVWRGSFATEINYQSWSFWSIIFGATEQGNIFTALTSHFRNLFQFFEYEGRLWILGLNTGVFGLMAYWVVLKMRHEMQPVSETPKMRFYVHIFNIIKAFAIFGIINGFYQIAHPIAAFIWLSFLSPIFMLWFFVSVKERSNLLISFGRTLSLIGRNIGTMLSVSFSMLLLGYMLSWIIASDFLWRYLDIVNWNLNLDEKWSLIVLHGFLVFLFIFIFNTILTILMGSIGILYSSLIEIKEGNHLAKRIVNIGYKKQVYGMEKER